MPPSHLRPPARVPRRPAPRPVSTLVAVVTAGVALASGVVDGRVTEGALDGPGEGVGAVRLAATAQPGAAAAPAGRADGVVPPGTTVFDDVPAVTKLDPALLGSLRRAATAAKAQDAVTFVVNSGWRSRKYQEQLLREATTTYGSRAEAARWVATPDTSRHVSGDAVDIGHAGATWLAAHGSRYGLCTVYRNESWHFELRPGAVRSGCPAMYADPTQDPRMRA